MNKALLSIGTNKDREENLNLCHQLLEELFANIVYSRTSVTTPYGVSYKNDFFNQLAIIYTDKEREDVSVLLKSLEKKMGRTSIDKERGVVKIDVDIVMWNDEILKPADISRSYIIDLLSGFQE